MSNGHTIAGGQESGPSFDMLHGPKGVSMAQDRTMYVADSSNNRIMKYNPGSMIGRRIDVRYLPGHRSDPLNGPSNVILDPSSSNWIICDCRNRRVLELARHVGACAKVLVENTACFGLAMDADRFLYVSDPERHEVRRYAAGSRHGTVVAGGHGQGDGLNQLDHPSYIAIDDDQSVYVSDAWNHRVMRWDKHAEQGVIVAGGHGRGERLDQLNQPTGLLIDRQGTVYVTDCRNNRVMRWRKGARQGDVIAGRLVPGYGANQLNAPEGLVFDRCGNLYVADSNNHRIQLFDIQIWSKTGKRPKARA